MTIALLILLVSLNALNFFLLAVVIQKIERLAEAEEMMRQAIVKLTVHLRDTASSLTTVFKYLKTKNYDSHLDA